jgi:hypothetical protein
MSMMYEGQIMKEEECFNKIDKPFHPPSCVSNVQKSSPPAPSKEEVIIRLVESLNIGGEEADYKRVDIAFMQYEQIQKKLNAWKEF